MSIPFEDDLRLIGTGNHVQYATTAERHENVCGHSLGRKSSYDSAIDCYETDSSNPIAVPRYCGLEKC